MKEHFLYDIFIGLLFLSIWLNLINGYLQSLINSLSDRFKLSLYSFSIIFAPLLADFVFNSSEKSPTTLATAALSAVLTLATRESFVWWKDRNDIKEEIFDELCSNYQTLVEFVHTHQSSNNRPDLKVSFQSQWTRSIKSKWIDQAFKNHFGKLQPRKIFSQTIIYDLRKIYESMTEAIDLANSGNPEFNDPNFVSNIFFRRENDNDNPGVLSDIRNLLIRINEKKANEFLTYSFQANPYN